MEQVFYPHMVTACKLTNFEIFDFQITLPSRSHDLENIKFAIISETVRDKRKQREFLTLAGLLHACKITNFAIFRSHDPQGHMTSKM